MIALLIGMLVGLLWAAMNVTIYTLTAASVLKMDPNAWRPFHWTVMVGPFAYYPWLRRQEKARELHRRSPFLIDPVPPTRAEISGEFLIPPSMVNRYAKGGPVFRTVEAGRITYSPHPPREAKAVLNGQGETVPAIGLGVVPVRREFTEGGPISGGVTLWFNEYMQMPSPRAKETRRDPITGAILDPTSDDIQYHLKHVVSGPSERRVTPTPTGCQHPHPEPVILTTAEVVAGVCPDCLQPLPPLSVGSDWKP